MNKFRNSNVSLVIITMFGFLLRVFKLDAKSLWIDEAYTIAFVQKSWGTIFSHHYLMRPAYFVMAKGWSSLFGYSEVASRMLSVLFGVLSIVMIYHLGKLLFNSKTGLLSALILAVSAYHVIRTQQARWYSFAMLLVILAAVYLLRIRRNPRLLYWVAYSMSLLILFYTNLAMGSIVFLLTNCFCFLFKIDLKRWISMQAVIILLSSILFIPVVAHHKIELEHDKYSPKVNINIFARLIEDFSYGKGVSQAGVNCFVDINRLWITKSGFYLVLCITYLVLLRLLLQQGKRRKKLRFSDGFVILWFSIPFITFFIVNMFVPFSKWIKIAIVILPPFCLIIGRMVLSFRPTINKLLISFLVLSSFASLSYYYYAPNQDSWREIAFLIKKDVQRGESILFFPMQQLTVFWYYYKYNESMQLKHIGDSFFGRTKKINGKWAKEFYDNDNLISGLELGNAPVDFDKFFERTAHQNTFWIVASPSWYGIENMRRLKLHISKNYLLEREYRFPWDMAEILYYRLVQ